MDKFRALQYFVAAAEERSFSGASRRLDVSVPAVSKLIAVLERSLGASLFDRTAQGITLTADGEGYLAACGPMLDELAAADEAVGSAVVHPHGTLVVGAPPFLALQCLLPALPRFHARYPDIRIDIRMVNQFTAADADASGVDILVMLGWPHNVELVQRTIGQTRLLACASPGYWAAQGIPQRPKDLERHVCLLFRGPTGTVQDLWHYERDEEKESATVSGWLVSDHRDLILAAVTAGEGIARLSDLTVRTYIKSGHLVPALLDWKMKEAQPVTVLYRPNHRRIPRVRFFIDFVTDLFSRLEAECEDAGSARVHAERPAWYRGHYGRASAATRGRK